MIGKGGRALAERQPGELPINTSTSKQGHWWELEVEGPHIVHCGLF